MTVSLSLKVLAPQEFAQTNEAEQPPGTPENTPREEWNTHTPELYTVTDVCSTSQSRSGGTMERDMNILRARIRYACGVLSQSQYHHRLHDR